MGYYSDTALALTGKGVDTLYKKLASPETSEETRKEVQDLLSQADSHYTDSNSGAEVWHWAWSKWYSNFPEVAFVESRWLRWMKRITVSSVLERITTILKYAEASGRIPYA